MHRGGVRLDASSTAAGNMCVGAVKERVQVPLQGRHSRSKRCASAPKLVISGKQTGAFPQRMAPCSIGLVHAARYDLVEFFGHRARFRELTSAAADRPELPPGNNAIPYCTKFERFGSGAGVACQRL